MPSMRVPRFVRRGLVAFAAVATLSLACAGVAAAQSPGAVVDGDDAIVFQPIPGYAYDVVHADGVRVATLAVSTGAGDNPVVVRFGTPFDGAAIKNIATPDVVADRP